QNQYSPLKMEEQVCVIWAGTNGYLDKLPLNRVKAFEEGVLGKLHADGAILEAIRTSKDLSDDTAAKLKSLVESFAASFA
ncbi:F0F1 ATP synthase subunit alpha, partial [Acinetobacter baumannii]